MYSSFNISIHTLRKEGDAAQKLSQLRADISIHTLNKEGDLIGSTQKCGAGIFQSTPSIKRVTLHEDGKPFTVGISIHTLHKEGDDYHNLPEDNDTVISIHTLHKEGDKHGTIEFRQHSDFNPHPP